MRNHDKELIVVDSAILAEVIQEAESFLQPPEAEALWKRLGNAALNGIVQFGIAVKNSYGIV